MLCSLWFIPEFEHERNCALFTNIYSSVRESNDFIIKDKDGNRIVKIIGYVGGVVPANDSRNITTNVTTDLKNAYDVEYEIVE